MHIIELKCTIHKIPINICQHCIILLGERGGTINVVHRRSRSDGTGLTEGDGKLPPTPVKRGVPAGGRRRRTRIPDKPDINFR